MKAVPLGFNRRDLTRFSVSVIFHGRVEEAYKSVQKHQKALLDEWKNSCNSTLKWIADSSARVQAQDKTAPDLDHARAQRQEIEVRKEELFVSDKDKKKHQAGNASVLNEKFPENKNMEIS